LIKLKRDYKNESLYEDRRSVARGRQVDRRGRDVQSSVISPAEGPPTHEFKDKRVEEEIANSESITARNPNSAETREMATKYIKDSEDKNFSGGGVWVMQRHGGTMVMAFGVKMRDFKKRRVLLAAAGIFVPDMTHLKRCGFIGGAMYKRERLRRAKKKDSVYPIDWRRRKWKS
jgi:hypothetical protein